MWLAKRRQRQRRRCNMEFFSAFNLRNVEDGKNGLEMVSICHHREGGLQQEDPCVVYPQFKHNRDNFLLLSSNATGETGSCYPLL